MKDGKAYFTQQEEDISNKYMSAYGPSPVMIGDDGVPIKSPTKNPLTSWMSCPFLDFECMIKRLAIFGVIAYVGYRVLIKKK